MNRYIDAERMHEDWLENGENEYVYDTNAVLQSIDEQPTADVVEVKYGRWVYDPDGMDWGIGAWRCSECGCKNDNLGSDRNINPYHYAGSKFCGNCAAKMDGKIKYIEICLSTELECSKCTPGPCSSRKQV